MDEKRLEFSLKSLEADAAIEALERRERGEPPDTDSPLSEKEIAAIRALAVDLDEQFVERKAAQLIGALQQSDPRELGSLDDARAARAARNAGVARDAGAARATRWRRLQKAGLVGVPLLAAGYLFWPMPMGPLDAGVGPVQLADSQVQRAAAPGAATAAPSADGVHLAAGGCMNVRVPVQRSAAQRSEKIATRAYLLKGKQTVRWNLALQPDSSGGLSNAAGCQRLPAGISGGAWELVVLVGYTGQLWWHEQAALAAAGGGGASGEYRGIKYVRQSLRFVADSAAPSR